MQLLDEARLERVVQLCGDVDGRIVRFQSRVLSFVMQVLEMCRPRTIWEPLVVGESGEQRLGFDVVDERREPICPDGQATDVLWLGASSFSL